MENKTSKHHYTYLFLKDAFTVILRLTLSTLIIVVLQSFLQVTNIFVPEKNKKQNLVPHIFKII